MPNLLFPKDAADTKRLARLAGQGQLTRIRHGVYTDAPLEQIPNLLNSKWFELVNHFCEKPVLVYRTAYEFKPFEKHVFVMCNVQKASKIAIGTGLTIMIYPFNSDCLIQEWGMGLRKSNLCRQLLENLSQSRSTAKVSKTLGVTWVEQQLCKELQTHGEQSLNQIRDEAKQFSKELNLTKEALKLDKIIGALLSTQSADGVLITKKAKGLANHLPIDEQRVELFQNLARYLKQCEFQNIKYQFNHSAWRNFSFFESYFSNYIEGTEFEINEAEQIVFSGKIIKNRNEDSHDIVSVYDIASDHQMMLEVPQNFSHFIELIQERHQLMMAQRPHVSPGQFKIKNNKAGDSLFVLPENLMGTMQLAFDEYQSLEKGLARGVFMQFLISECHPFNDGNGRLSRIMLNAELYSAGLSKIIIPTVHRESYLNGLRKATRQGKFRALVKVFFQMQQYASEINWEDYSDVLELIQDHAWNKHPDEGVGDFNRQLIQFKMKYPVE